MPRTKKNLAPESEKADSENSINTEEKRRNLGGRPPKSAPDPDAVPISRNDSDSSPEASGIGPETFILFPQADKRRQPFVRVHREDENRRWVLHGIFPPEDATEMAVALLFGGGKYSAQLIERDDNGMGVIKASRTFRLPGKYIPPTGDLPGLKPNSPEVARLLSGAPPTAPQQQQGFKPEMAPSPREAIDMAFATKMLEVLKPATELAKGPSLVDSLPALLTAATPIIVALFQRKTEPDPMLKQVFDAINGLAEKLSVPAPVVQTPVSGALAAMEDIAKFQNLLKTFTGGKAGSDDDDDETPKPNLDQQMIAMGMELLKNMTAKPQAVQQPQPQQPAVSGVAMNPVENLVLQYGPQLIDAAGRGINPSLVAGIVQEYCPPNQTGALQELIAREDLETYLPQLLPPLKAFPKWLHEFVEELRSMGAEVEEDEEGEPEGGS